MSQLCSIRHLIEEPVCCSEGKLNALLLSTNAIFYKSAVYNAPHCNNMSQLHQIFQSDNVSFTRILNEVSNRSPYFHTVLSVRPA